IADAPTKSGEVGAVHTTAAQYCAILGDVAAFTPVLLDLTRRTGFTQAELACITADGALWIWNLAVTYFPASTQLLDYYHARQHLSSAAHALFPDRPWRSDTWLHADMDDLFDGALTPIIADPQQADLTECATYFHSHQARMRYADFQQQGFPIGSGSVES